MFTYNVVADSKRRCDIIWGGGGKVMRKQILSTMSLDRDL